MATEITHAAQLKYRDRWRALMLRKGRLAWDFAVFSRDVFEDSGGEQKAAYRSFTKMGIKSKNLLYRKYDALKTVPDRDVWVAVDWPGIRALCAMTAKQRKAMLKEIRRLADGGELPKERVAKLLPLRPKQPDATPSADQPKAPESRPAISDPSRLRKERDAMTRCVLRIIGGPFPGLKTLMTTGERDLFGLSDSGKRVG